jgi:hypothetical protein
VTNKRLGAFVLTAGLLTAALYAANPDIYPVYAATLGTIFGVYATGQSYTDAKETEQR